MEEVLVALGVAILAAFGTAGASLGGAVWYLRRRNRVHPRHRSPAPLAWLVSPGAAARAHRQLRAAVLLTRSGLSPALADQADELGRHAVALDTELVQVARLPRAHRRAPLRALQHQVVVVERTAVQLVGLSRRRAVPSPPGPVEELARLAERVSLVAAAHDELAVAASPTASRASAAGGTS